MSDDLVQDNRPVWVITGASSGIGEAIALEVIQTVAAQVVVIGRNEEKLQSFRKIGGHIITLNIADTDGNLTTVIDRIVSSTGRIDVLVNAAGYLLEGGFEETSEAESNDVFQTNFFGPLRLIRATLPHMRCAGTGIIFNVGGIATYNGSPNAGLYCASKAAMSTLTEALQRETELLGIRVCLVQLGHFRTPFLTPGHRRRVRGHVEDYDAGLDPLRKAFNNLNGTQSGDPKKAAQIVVKLACGSIQDIPFCLPLGSDVSSAMERAYKTEIESFKATESLTNSTNLV